MKKIAPYIAAGILLILLLVVLFGNSNKKQFDDRVTLDKKGKNPYGTQVAFELIKKYFNSAEVLVNREEPYTWYYNKKEEVEDSVLLITVTKKFNPNQYELEFLSEFVKAGNQIMVVTPHMNNDAKQFFDVQLSVNYSVSAVPMQDSITTHLLKPAVARDTNYFYPGKGYNIYFSKYNSNKLQKIGCDTFGRANFLRGKLQEGFFYLHTNPLVFSNYFLLYQDNASYLANTLSLVRPNVKKVIWDEYYVYREEDNTTPPESSPLRILMKIPAFKWAIWLSVILMAIYLFVHLKRKQRIVPILAKPQNTSLEFVKTIGRLYFEKKDHVNLARKMVAYFLEHVRSKYFIHTQQLDEAFVQKLSGKAGVQEQVVRDIIKSINAIENSDNISQNQLNEYYLQFNQFYKSTI